MTINAMAVNPMIDEILRENPTLKALMASSLSSYQNAQADNSLPGPEAEFEYLLGPSGATKWSLGVTQSFDWPGAYKSRSKVNELKKTEVVYLFQAKKMEITSEANGLLIRYRYCGERKKLLSDIYDALTKLEEQLKSALDHGLVTILDYKKAGIERYAIERDIRLVEADLAEIRTNLNELAGRNLDWETFSPVLTGRLEDSPEIYVEEALRLDPTLKVTALSSRIADLEAEVAKREMMPSFAVGYRHEKEEGVHFNGFSLSVGLPTWGVKKKTQATRAAVLEAVTEEDLTRATLAASIRSRWEQADALRRDLEAVNEAGIDTEYLKLLTMAYEGGELSVLDYIRELTYCREVTANIIDLKERYDALLASLNRYSL